MDEHRLYKLHTYRSFNRYNSHLLEFVIFITQKLNSNLPDLQLKIKKAFKCIFNSQLYFQVPITEDF